MSLIFTGTQQNREGISIDNAYGRVSVTDSVAGSSLIISVHVFNTKVSYEAGKLNTYLTYVDADGNVQIVPDSFSVPYNRQTNGTDILQLAHNFVKSHYESLGIAIEVVL